MRIDGKYWAGMVAGAGLGLLLGAAFVEMGALTSSHRAWASVLGIILMTVGNVAYWRLHKLGR